MTFMTWVKLDGGDQRCGPGKRWGHTCNAVLGGRLLYVFGGYSGQDKFLTNDVHVFNVAEQSWIEPLIGGTPPIPRHSHSCTTVDDSLFVFGGTNGFHSLDDLKILDTYSHTWISPILKGQRPPAREGHGAALVGNCLYIFGGCSKSLVKNVKPVFYNDLYVLDTETFACVQATTSGISPSPRESHTCSSWKNTIIVIGGEDKSGLPMSDVHMLDTGAMIWMELNTSGQRLPPRSGHSTVVYGKILFVLGGCANDINVFNDIHMFDVDTGFWTKVRTIGIGPSARFCVAGDCLAPMMAGALVFIGGCNKNLEALDDMYYLYTGILQKRVSMKKKLKNKCQEQFLISGIKSVQGKRQFVAKVTDKVAGGFSIETTIDGTYFRGMVFYDKPNPALIHHHSSRKRAAGEVGDVNSNQGIIICKSKSPRTTVQKDPTDLRQAEDVHGKKLMLYDPHRKFADTTASNSPTPASVLMHSVRSDVSKSPRVVQGDPTDLNRAGDVHGKELVLYDPHTELADASASKSTTHASVLMKSVPSDVSTDLNLAGDVHGKGFKLYDPHTKFVDASASKSTTPASVSMKSVPSDASKSPSIVLGRPRDLSQAGDVHGKEVMSRDPRREFLATSVSRISISVPSDVSKKRTAGEVGMSHGKELMSCDPHREFLNTRPSESLAPGITIHSVPSVVSKKRTSEVGISSRRSHRKELISHPHRPSADASASRSSTPASSLPTILSEREEDDAPSPEEMSE